TRTPATPGSLVAARGTASRWALRSATKWPNSCSTARRPRRGFRIHPSMHPVSLAERQAGSSRTPDLPHYLHPQLHLARVVGADDRAERPRTSIAVRGGEVRAVEQVECLDTNFEPPGG